MLNIRCTVISSAWSSFGVTCKIPSWIWGLEDTETQFLRPFRFCTVNPKEKEKLLEIISWTACVCEERNTWCQYPLARIAFCLSLYPGHLHTLFTSSFSLKKPKMELWVISLNCHSFPFPRSAWPANYPSISRFIEAFWFHCDGLHFRSDQ